MCLLNGVWILSGFFAIMNKSIMKLCVCPIAHVYDLLRIHLGVELFAYRMCASSFLLGNVHLS